MSQANETRLNEQREELQYVFFSDATLNDGITQPPGGQMTSTMAHFVDNKGAFYDLPSQGFFYKNLTLFLYREETAKIGKKNLFFAFSLKSFSLNFSHF